MTAPTYGIGRKSFVQKGDGGVICGVNTATSVKAYFADFENDLKVLDKDPVWGKCYYRFKRALALLQDFEKYVQTDEELVLGRIRNSRVFLNSWLENAPELQGLDLPQSEAFRDLYGSLLNSIKDHWANVQNVRTDMENFERRSDQQVLDDLTEQLLKHVWLVDAHIVARVVALHLNRLGSRTSLRSFMAGMQSTLVIAALLGWIWWWPASLAAAAGFIGFRVVLAAREKKMVNLIGSVLSELRLETLDAEVLRHRLFEVEALSGQAIRSSAYKLVSVLETQNSLDVT